MVGTVRTIAIAGLCLIGTGLTINYITREPTIERRRRIPLPHYQNRPDLHENPKDFPTLPFPEEPPLIASTAVPYERAPGTLTSLL